MGSEWPVFPLTECMEEIIDYRGKTPRKTAYGIPLITAKIVKNGRILQAQEYISEDQYNSWMRRGMPQEGDVVLTTEAPLGEVAQLDSRKVALAQRVITLRGKKGLLDNTFLKYLLISDPIQNQLQGRSSGTTVSGIRQSELRKVILPVPPITVQHAIAHILGTLDDKIELNRRMNETLEGMARALFKSWFIDFDPVRAKAEGRDTGLSSEIDKLFPDEFVDSELGEIPKGWEVRTLAQLFEINPSRTLRKNQIAPYLDMANMPTKGHCALKVIDRAFGSGTRFISGDTLLARITPCLENGKTAFVDFLGGNQVGWGSTEYIVLRPLPPLPEEFAYCLTRSPKFRDHAIQSMTGSSGRQRVQTDSLASFSLSFPLEAGGIANAFKGRVRPLFQRVAASQRENESLSSLRDTLLPKLISGEIRVEDAEKFLEVRKA